MKQGIATMTTLVMLGALVALPVAAADAGAGSGTLCRREDASLTGARCWEAQVTSEGNSETACVPKNGSPGVHSCTSQVSITLTASGVTEICGWTWSAPTGEALACNYLLVIPQRVVLNGIYTFDTTDPFGQRSVRVHYCVDYGIPIQDCAEYDLIVNYHTTSAAVDPIGALPEVQEALSDSVDFYANVHPADTNIV